MASAGKSHWSLKLENAGYLRLNCDDLIEEKLKPELEALGLHGLSDVAKWMGFPYEPQYPQTSKEYLAFENEVMRTIFETTRSGVFDSKDVIIDTTGSVIYTDKTILDDLQKLSTVIYLEIPESKRRELYREFLQNPKPIIWGDSYQPQTGETEKETLARCYNDLLAYRARRYKEIANLTIPFDIHRQKGFSALDFISHIKAQ